MDPQGLAKFEMTRKMGAIETMTKKLNTVYQCSQCLMADTLFLAQWKQSLTHSDPPFQISRNNLKILFFEFWPKNPYTYSQDIGE